MKKFFTAMISAVLALVLAFTPAMRVMAAGSGGNDYISEVKVGVGKTAEEAKAALEGYTVIETDLNEDAGGGWGSKGDRVVYLGYKTTKSASEGITDLAVMNMKGGYRTRDYEALMESQMKSQIIPLVEMFQATIEEYRENYNSANPDNRKRAHYIYEMLNKLTDDDCGGAGLGDLMLNETKYEMGDAAYEALSDAEKDEHADIVTIIAQANGQATLMLLNLLTRGADTEDNSWMDRFKDTTYEDMVEATGMMPADAEKELAKLYDDGANIILDMWDAFQQVLLSAEESERKLQQIDDGSSEALEDKLDALDENSGADEIGSAADDVLNDQIDTVDAINAAANVAAVRYLQGIPYGDGTMFDFFLQDYDEVAADSTVLYPMVASLSPGQRAGLEYISLQELVLISITDNEYSDENLEELEGASIYDGVDRGIYEKGGVALTSDALRAEALAEEESVSSNPFSALTITFMVLTGVAAIGAIGSVGELARGAVLKARMTSSGRYMEVMADAFEEEAVQASQELQNALKTARTAKTRYYNFMGTGFRRAAVVKGLAIGFSAALVIFSALTVYLSYRDLVDYYDVEFTPIPLYIVDEKDITAYNNKGEKIVIKNQSAYYKACQTNRNPGDDYYDKIGTNADLNGAVGRQWLALYSVKNEAEDPILADSLKVVTGNSQIPAGYSTGIHMFGSDTALNLNSDAYIWNANARDTFVYFKRDEGAKNASTTGSMFSGGTIAVAGGAGLIVGAGIAALIMTAVRKKKERAAK